jgi:hypothetical protein
MPEEIEKFADLQNPAVIDIDPVAQEALRSLGLSLSENGLVLCEVAEGEYGDILTQYIDPEQFRNIQSIKIIPEWPEGVEHEAPLVENLIISIKYKDGKIEKLRRGKRGSEIVEELMADS